MTTETSATVLPPKKPARRRKRGEGSIRKRGQNYFAILSVNGHKMERRAGPRSADAVQLLSVWKEELRHGTLRTEKAPTFAAFVGQVKEIDSRRLKPSTLSAYNSIYKVHLVPYFGHRRLDQITAAVVTRFFSELAGRNASKKRQPVATKTLINCHRLLSRVFSFAIDLQYLVRSPLPKPGKLFARVEQREMDFLRPHEVRTLLAAIDDVEMKAMIATMILTGMRVGEIVGLMWDCVDFKAKTIRVKRAFSRGQLLTPKTRNSNRLIQAGDNVMALLREHKLLAGARSEFVFSTSTGKHIDGANLLKRVLRPALTKAKIDRPLRLHDLRHTYSSIMISENANLKFVSMQLGHASIQITLDRYSHLIPERHAETVAHVDDLLLGSA